MCLKTLWFNIYISIIQFNIHRNTIHDLSRRDVKIYTRNTGRPVKYGMVILLIVLVYTCVYPITSSCYRNQVKTNTIFRKKKFKQHLKNKTILIFNLSNCLHAILLPPFNWKQCQPDNFTRNNKCSLCSHNCVRGL